VAQEKEVQGLVAEVVVMDLGGTCHHVLQYAGDACGVAYGQNQCMLAHEPIVGSQTMHVQQGALHGAPDWSSSVL
jgi:hypothetical protein